MLLSFWLENHNVIGQSSLEDVIGIIGHQARALGHHAVWDHSIRNKFIGGAMGYNVIVEGFTPGIIKVIADAHAQGARFICIATEEPTPKGFNHGTQIEMVKRQERWPEVAPFIDGTIHLVPGEHVTNWFSQFGPTAYSELGYAPTLVRPTHGITPTFEFGFYGSLTKRRLKILKRLRDVSNAAKAVKIVSDFKSQHERDKLMQEAKVIVQIRKFEEMGLVSSSRCNTALCLGRPVVAEPHLLSKPWDEIVKFTDTIEGFINTAMITKAAWKGIHAAQFERFKDKLGPRSPICVGAALEKFGIVSPIHQRRTA